MELESGGEKRQQNGYENEFFYGIFTNPHSGEMTMVEIIQQNWGNIFCYFEYGIN